MLKSGKKSDLPKLPNLSQYSALQPPDLKALVEKMKGVTNFDILRLLQTGGFDLTQLPGADLALNILFTGVSSTFPATVTDEEWVKHASLLFKTHGTTKALYLMINILRSYLGGAPKTIPPNRHDACPCGGGKKFGKCCGAMFEPGDPEECVAKGHNWTIWTKTPWDGKWFRGCKLCHLVEDADCPVEMTIDKTLVVGIPCRICGKRPTDTEILEIGIRELKQAACLYCDTSVSTDLLVIQHTIVDKKHVDAWAYTYAGGVVGGPVDIGSDIVGKGGFIHLECLPKALPGWDKRGLTKQPDGSYGSPKDVKPKEEEPYF